MNMDKIYLNSNGTPIKLSLPANSIFTNIFDSSGQRNFVKAFFRKTEYDIPCIVHNTNKTCSLFCSLFPAKRLGHIYRIPIATLMSLNLQKLSYQPHSVIVVVVVIQALHGSITTRQKYKGTSSMNCRKQRSHARGVYAKGLPIELPEGCKSPYHRLD